MKLIAATLATATALMTGFVPSTTPSKADLQQQAIFDIDAEPAIFDIDAGALIFDIDAGALIFDID